MLFSHFFFIFCFKWNPQIVAVKGLRRILKPLVLLLHKPKEKNTSLVGDHTSRSSLVQWHLPWGWCWNWWLRFGGTDGQALIHGRMKDTMSTMRERERGSEKRRRRGRENDDGHRDIRTLLSPLWWTSCALFCDWTFGRQMTSGRTCDMLSCRTQKKRRSCCCYCLKGTITIVACFSDLFEAQKVLKEALKAVGQA